MSDVSKRVAEMSPERRELLLRRLREKQVTAPPRPAPTLPAMVTNREARNEPFPLSPIQRAYWTGRSGLFDLGAVGTNVYTEAEVSWATPSRMNANRTNLLLIALNRSLERVVQRHDMLRMVILPSGQQQILPQAPPYRINVVDLRRSDPATIEARLEEVRHRMQTAKAPVDRWPLFEIMAHRLPGERLRLHIRLDSLLVDGTSRGMFLQELFRHLGPGPLAPRPPGYRDYVLTWLAFEESELGQSARDYWLSRLPTLPPVIELPLATNLSPETISLFVKHNVTLLDAETWARLKARAARADLTPSGLTTAAFVEVLCAWSQRRRFTLGLIGTYRPPIHKRIGETLGNFNTVYLLEVDDAPGSFEARARRIQQQIAADLEQRYFLGHQVLQELNRRSGGSSRPALPIVFNSVIEYSHASYQTNFGRGAGSRLSFEQVDAGLHIPQMLLSPTVSENGAGALTCSWQSVEQVFPERLMQDMLDSYGRFLHRLASDETSWQEQLPSLIPAEQLARRAALTVDAPPPQELLHSLFLAQVYLRPRQTAVVAGDRTLTYGELGRRVAQVGRRLRELGARPNSLVAVVMEPGWEQIVAALGVLESGAAYAPIDPALPGERFRRLLVHSETTIVLTQSSLDQRLEWPSQIQRLCLDTDEWRGIDDHTIEPVQQSDDLAYVIYTDADAEPPLAAMIDHTSAVNTILDVNRRYDVSSQDRLLALAPLNSDLAVYDIFGTLAAGGTIVVPAARHDPAYLAELMLRERVTVWNSPPALLERLVTYVADKPELHPRTLRLALLSRDWTPVTLAERLRALVPDVNVVNQGGATEAGIWSSSTAIERLDPEASRVPLGAPLTNQRLHVLHESLEPAPDWVPGEIFIGGLSVGKGYWRNAAETRARFLKHPRTGERLYRTGDQGRYVPGGEIELLGRAGEHVTIAGHPVDPREIEAALERHPALRSAVVRAYTDEAGKAYLVAYVVGEQKNQGTKEQSTASLPSPVAAEAEASRGSGKGLGVRATGEGQPSPLELRNYLRGRFPHYMIPAAFVALDELPLTTDGIVDRQALPQPSIERSRADVFVAPRDQLEQQLATIWQELLGREPIGVTANFFDLGGTSFLAVRLLTLIQQVFGHSLALTDFFAQPTIEQLARVVRETTIEQLAQRLDEQRDSIRQQPIALPKLTRAAPQIEGGRAALNGHTRENGVEQQNAARGMQVFFVIWIGQLVSIIGSGLTGFALGVWVLQETGSVTEFALISLFAMLPFILISPIAGVLVDRWDRRKAMIVSDTVAALTTLAIVLLYRADNLSIWMIYLLTAISSASRAFQLPAYTAATTLLVPREQLGRANGLVQLAQGIGQLISPVLAGVLVTWIGLSGVIAVDLITFIFAVITLMAVRIPRPEISAEGRQARGSLRQESAFGWHYIKQRPGLMGLLIFFAASNFLVSMVVVLANPLVLSFPSGSPAVLGTVLSVAGAGMLVGSIVMSIWGGPRRRVNGVLIPMALSAVCIILAGLQPSALLLTVMAFFFLFTMPFVGASSQAIWQSKVPADIQGRVFSTRAMIATAATPIAYLIAGPLADYVFQPLLENADAPLASSIGQIIGYGPGRGIGLMFIVFGLLTLLAVVLGYMYPRIRLVEDELPDAGLEAIDEDEDEPEPVSTAPQPL
ncbi:MAG TPA: amino acid adenylation domain-containing protein [Herpetosiphonaceae bacterium]